MTQIITRIRAGASTGEDEYGNEIPGDPEELDVVCRSVQPGGGLEVLDRREATTTLYTAWTCDIDKITETDDVRYAGTVYEVDGPIERWRGVSRPHDVIRLKAVGG